MEVDVASPQQVLDCLADALNQRTKWDERAGLYTLTQLGSALHLDEVQLPHQLWSRVPAPRIPAVLAANGILARRRAYGVALQFESYTITSDTGPQAHDAVRRRLMGRCAPSNKDIPGRLEERCFLAVLRSGDRFMVSNIRNPDSTARPGTRLHFGAEDQHLHASAVADSLTA
jgi:hypothetical protein